MNRVIFLFVLVLSLQAGAQNRLSLQQCIDSALAANIPVRQSELDMQRAGVDLRQARENLLPDLNTTVWHSLNSGRSIDPFTNTFVTQSVNAANYGVSSGVVVFNGGALQHTVRQQALGYEAARMEWQQRKDELVINVIAAYLDVLNAEDAVQLSVQQAEVTQRALDRLKILDSQGAVRPSDVTDLKGQWMNDGLVLLNNRNALAAARLRLAQWMNRPYDPSLQLERIDAGAFLAPYASGSGDVYTQSLTRFSAVKAVELRSRSAYYNWRSARGALWPTVRLGMGVNTNYSSLAQNASGKISYGSQLTNNRFSSLGVGLSIPIFNNFIARNNIRRAEIQWKRSELDELNTKQTLQRQIEGAYLNMTNAYERYKLLLEQVAAYRQSAGAAEARFTAGVGNSVDYLTAKDRLDRANLNLVAAKYDFVLRKRILDYYAGMAGE